MRDGTVGHVQPMLEIKALAVTRCSVDLLLHQVAVLAMNSREDKIHRRFRPRITLKDSEGLVGPEDLPSGDLPAKAARMTEPLCFCQVRFAPAEFLGPALLPRNVYGPTNGSSQRPVRDNTNTNATDV